MSKIEALDGDISEFKIKENYDLAFIDGIHTDTNVFSDFLFTLDIMNNNSIILFHDSNVIFKSLSLIIIFLKKKNIVLKSVNLKIHLSQEFFWENFLKYNLKIN